MEKAKFLLWKKQRLAWKKQNKITSLEKALTKINMEKQYTLAKKNNTEKAKKKNLIMISVITYTGKQKEFYLVDNNNTNIMSLIAIIRTINNNKF